MRLVLIGLVAGLFSSLFGVGGGIVIVPLLILLVAFGTKEATATSLGAIVITALAGVTLYALARQGRRFLSPCSSASRRWRERSSARRPRDGSPTGP